MGTLLSRIFSRTAKEDNFEQILSELDAKIYRTEIAIAETKLRQRKVIALWTTYTSVLFLFWLLSFFLMTWPYLDGRHDGWLHVLVHTSPVFLVPLAIYLSRSLLDFYYRRSIQYHEQELESFKKQQKQKVEEMKQKMKYYVAKNLIERYESSSPRKPQTPSRKPSIRYNGGRNVQSLDINRSGAIVSMPALNSIGNEIVPLPSQGQPILSPQQSQNNPNISHQQSVPQISPLNPSQHHLNQPPQMFHQHNDLQSYQRTWVDRLLDVIIGEESPSSKYALVCQQCFAHNGLASPQEFEHLQYKCPKCGFFNSKRQVRSNNVNNNIGSVHSQQRSSSQMSLDESGMDHEISPAKSDSVLDDRSYRRVSDSFVPSSLQTDINQEEKKEIIENPIEDSVETAATELLVRKRSSTIAATRKPESNE